MPSYTGAIACLVVAALLAVISHPRVVYGDGNGVAMNIVSFDDVFFAAQWATVVFCLLSLAMYVVTARGATTMSAPWAVPVVASALLAYLIFAGIPHPANRAEWPTRELGIRAFVRGMAKRRAASPKLVKISANAFAGSWRAVDGTTYEFFPDSISLHSAAGPGEYSRATCGATFELVYVERSRDVLRDLGLPWSLHAIALHDSTPVNARIPVANMACGNDRFVFIRATEGEVWRWTNALDADAIKRDSFVLRAAIGLDSKPDMPQHKLR